MRWVRSVRRCARYRRNVVALAPIPVVGQPRLSRDWPRLEDELAHRIAEVRSPMRRKRRRMGWKGPEAMASGGRPSRKAVTALESARERGVRSEAYLGLSSTRQRRVGRAPQAHQDGRNPCGHRAGPGYEDLSSAP